MLSISDWAAHELATILPQAVELIKHSDNVHDANIKRRLIKMAKYMSNAERKKHKLRVGKAAEASS